MTKAKSSGTFALGDRQVNRMGYGAMQLAGPGVFGPPKDRSKAIAVLREAVESGVNHIDTSDYYGPYITNQIIREALYPYQDELTIVTKVGAVRGSDASWNAAQSPAELVAAVHDNLRNLNVDVLDVVNLRRHEVEVSVREQFTALAELQQRGLIRHLGLSNVTAAEIKEAQSIAPVVCVQNMFNVMHRQDDLLVDALEVQGVAFVPFFPLGGISPLQSSTLSGVAGSLGATSMQVALAWLLQRSSNILLIPGTSSLEHLRENLAAGSIVLSSEALERLDGVV